MRCLLIAINSSDILSHHYPNQSDYPSEVGEMDGGVGTWREIRADEHGAECIADVGLLERIEEPLVETGAEIGLTHVGNGVGDLVVGTRVVALVAADEAPEGFVLQMIVGLGDVGLEIGRVADILLPRVLELTDELVREIDERSVDAALLDEVDDGEQEHGLVRGLHAVAAGDVQMGEEFC